MFNNVLKVALYLTMGAAVTAFGVYYCYSNHFSPQEYNSVLEEKELVLREKDEISQQLEQSNQTLNTLKKEKSVLEITYAEEKAEINQRLEETNQRLESLIAEKKHLEAQQAAEKVDFTQQITKSKQQIDCLKKEKSTLEADLNAISAEFNQNSKGSEQNAKHFEKGNLKIVIQDLRTRHAAELSTIKSQAQNEKQELKAKHADELIKTKSGMLEKVNEAYSENPEIRNSKTGKWQYQFVDNEGKIVFGLPDGVTIIKKTYDEYLSEQAKNK